jgi:hypothetical protein
MSWQRLVAIAVVMGWQAVLPMIGLFYVLGMLK